MPRDTSRKIKKDPGGVGAVVQRNSTGTVQTSSHKSGSNTGFSNTTGTTIGTLSGTGLMVFTTAKASVSGTPGTATTPIQITISRNGSQLTTGTLTANGTVSVTGQTHTTPLNAPNWTFKGSVSGGNTTVNFTASREDRWV